VSLRMLEAVVPREDVAAVAAELAEQDTIGVWTSELSEEEGLLRVLVSTEGTEALTDRLAARYTAWPGFRTMLFAVEATLPALEDEARETEGGTHTGEEPVDTGPLRISREELHQDLSESTRVSPVFLTTVALSTAVAAVGLIQGSVAVVIGAMVIAPLLGPNVALALASTLGDVTLARHALKANIAGVTTALALSVAVGSLVSVDPTSPEIASRTVVGPGDVALALAAGAAGTLAFTQGLSAAVIGVMVAVALLPPLVATGLLFGAGHFADAYGALSLVGVNVACVNLAGVVTFLAQRVRPRTWWESERATRAARIAVASWVAMLALLIALVVS